MHETARRSARPVGAPIAIVALALAVAACGSDTPSRQQAVAEAGGEVMPFDLEATTHVFEPDVTGGVQTVVADDPADEEQIALVRSHLRDEATRFRGGDFGDPKTIHGDEMPGLAVLEESAGRLDVSYSDVDDGAKITYRSDDRIVITALHDWFAAQVADHGSHAEG